MKKCPKCGQPIGDAKFCPNCGYALNKGSQTSQSSTQKQVDMVKNKAKQMKDNFDWSKFKNNKWLIVGLIVIFVVLFGGIKYNHSLNRILPGHAYQLSGTSKYVVFGSGKHRQSLIILYSRPNAVDALKNSSRFDYAYINRWDEDVVEGHPINFKESTYNFSNKTIQLHIAVHWVPDDDYFAGTDDGDEPETIEGQVGKHVVTPFLEGVINNYINENNVQYAQATTTISNVRVHGLFKHTITGTMKTENSTKSVKLVEVK